MRALVWLGLSELGEQACNYLKTQIFNKVYDCKWINVKISGDN